MPRKKRTPAEQRAEEERLAANWDKAFPEDQPEPGESTELRHIIHEFARRQIEALKLYEPMPEQDKFHRSRCPMRLVRGSNRSGKTLCTHVEIARAVCGCDPYNKYPKNNGRIFLVGKDLDHIGRVMWQKLGKAGAFKIIRDSQTGMWRAFRPWVEADLARVAEAKPAPPLIPPRLIKYIGWENKKQGVPNFIVLHNGWEMSFYSSLGLPTKGADIDIFLFDEEIVNEQWYPEMCARILDRNGCGIWGATPEAGTDQLYELHERAVMETQLPRFYGTGKDSRARKVAVEEFVLLLQENLHITEEVKQQFIANLSEEQIRVKVEGQFAQLGFKVYPEFSMSRHGVTYREIPQQWTRYMVVDPGHQICAVLFAAVSPPEDGDSIYLYDELYLKDCNANMFAENVRQKASGQRFQAFIVDMHMALHTEVGIGRNIADQYAQALREAGVKSYATGSNFLMASDDLGAGVMAVHDLLRDRTDKGPRLRVLEGVLPAFEYEIKRYHRKREAGVVIDKPNQKKSNHLMDCLRYLAMYNPRYVPPQLGKARIGGALKAFRDRQKRKREDDGGPFIRLGPGRK